jgi:hypothetical protein
VAFASRHDRHFGKHYAIPGIGFLMNMAELLGIFYIAVTGSGTTPGDAYKAMGVVILWCVIGAVWVGLNPKMRGTKVIHDPGQRAPSTVGAA